MEVEAQTSWFAERMGMLWSTTKWRVHRIYHRHDIFPPGACEADNSGFTASLRHSTAHGLHGSDGPKPLDAASCESTLPRLMFPLLLPFLGRFADKPKSLCPPWSSSSMPV